MTKKKAQEMLARQPKNRGGPLEFAEPHKTVWNEAHHAVVPAELSQLPDDHYEPFRSPLRNAETGEWEPKGAALGWRLTSKGRAACEAAGGPPDTSPKKVAEE